MKLTKLLLTVLAIVFSTIALNAQNFDSFYDNKMSESDGTWQSISLSQRLTYGDDSYAFYRLPSDFAFTHDGLNIQSTSGYVFVNCNGFMSIGNSGYTSYNANPGQYGAGMMVIAPMRGDGYTHTGIYVQITGARPNRVATWQWVGYNTHYYYGDLRIDFQVKFFETTNVIQIIYGPRTGTAYPSYTRQLYISGRRISPYGPAWNVILGTPNRMIKGYNTPTGPESGWNTYGIAPALIPTHLYQGKTFTYGKSEPELVGIYPEGGEIYRKGAQYGGSDPSEHPAVFVKRDAGMADILLTYQISGPVGASVPTIIYRAHQSPGNYEVDPGDIQGDPFRYDFTAGIGPCFGTDGILDLESNQGSFDAAEYKAEASMIIDEVGTTDFAPSFFNIALPNDIAITKLQRPRSKYEKKYPLGEIDLIVRVTNLGLNPQSHFRVDLDLFDKDGNQIGQTRSDEYDDLDDMLETGENEEINLGTFYPDDVGDYSLEASVTLLSATDQQPSNNIIPRAGDPDFVFTVAKEVDIRAVSIVYPTTDDEVVVGRPINPIARFTNQGVNDLDFDSVFFEITYLPTDEVVFRDTLVNYVISAGANFDTTDINTEKNFVPPYLGAYEICATIYSPYDNNPISMRKRCGTFESNAGLIGTYTIGSGGNFETIQDAVDE
ncbi:hypothetical protein ACFLSQ_09355, partial [Bacteroidota bacterium]